MKQKVVKILSNIPFINSYYSGIAVIFMLHRVAPFEKNKLLPNENMKISPQFLEKFIIELKNKGYDFISLDELFEILQSGKKVKKKIIFTLDDGYKDNFAIAYPIFKKYKVPFTVYITTCFPEKSAILWWYILEDLILKNEEILLANGTRFRCKTFKEKEKAFMAIRALILKLDHNNFLKELNSLFKNYEINWFQRNEELCMSWEDIVTLSNDPLVTIGSHTKNHLVLSRLSEENIIKEIVEANELIEEKIGKKVEHFAYPFGGIEEVCKREMEIVKKLGFKTVVTTRRGTIYPEHKDFCNCCLPRIMLTEEFCIKDIGKPRKKRVVTI